MAKQKQRWEDLAAIRIGCGVVAEIHHQKFEEIGITTFGYLESNPAQREKARTRGYQVFETVHAALAAWQSSSSRPCMWDICTPTRTHLEVLRSVLQLDPAGCILVEKPVCECSQIEELKAIIAEYPHAKIVVNENYQGAEVTRRVADLAKRYTPYRVLSEMSKQRLPDFRRGRFLDLESGALGYELSHMLTTVTDLGPGYLPVTILGAQLEDAVLDETEAGGQALRRTQSEPIPLNSTKHHSISPHWSGCGASLSLCALNMGGTHMPRGEAFEQTQPRPLPMHATNIARNDCGSASR